MTRQGIEIPIEQMSTSAGGTAISPAPGEWYLSTMRWIGWKWCWKANPVNIPMPWESRFSARMS